MNKKMMNLYLVYLIDFFNYPKGKESSLRIIIFNGINVLINNNLNDFIFEAKL